MSPPWYRLTVVLTLGFASSLVSACNTGAIGITECRNLETQRCSAAAECGDIDDIPACERYVRDNCLHGIAGPKVPTKSQLDACMAVITAGQSCAKDDPKMLASRCDEFEEDALTPIPGANRARTVCDVIRRPWDFKPCNFLNEEQDGSGGEESE